MIWIRNHKWSLLSFVPGYGSIFAVYEIVGYLERHRMMESHPKPGYAPSVRHFGLIMGGHFLAFVASIVLAATGLKREPIPRFAAFAALILNGLTIVTVFPPV